MFNNNNNYYYYYDYDYYDYDYHFPRWESHGGRATALPRPAGQKRGGAHRLPQGLLAKNEIRGPPLDPEGQGDSRKLARTWVQKDKVICATGPGKDKGTAGSRPTPPQKKKR